MMKMRYNTPGSAPATLNPLPGPVEKPELRYMEYGEGGCEEKHVESVEDFPMAAADGKMRWLEMNGLGDVEALKLLGTRYNLHPLALEDVLNIGQRPKVDTYDDQLFIIAQMIYADHERCKLSAEQVGIFVCENMLISIQEDKERDLFEPVRARIRRASGYIRKMHSDYLAYALLDAIVDHGFPVLEKLGTGIEELEEEILEKPKKESASEIHALRRTLLQLRRYVWPERDLVSCLLHTEHPLVFPETKIFLRDLYDHTIQIMDLIESYRDVATSMFEMYLSRVSLRTNEIMRVLTVISSIFIPLTFLVGVYGMNFQLQTQDGEAAPSNMPELHWKYGYVVLWVLMALIAVGQLIFFRKKKWL